jgi:hypothetical protein
VVRTSSVAMPRWRRTLNTVGGLALLSGLGYCTYRYSTVDDRVQAACSEIIPGMTFSQVEAIASGKGLTASKGTEDISFVVATETLGDDFKCRISWKQGVVESSTYRGPREA